MIKRLDILIVGTTLWLITGFIVTVIVAWLVAWLCQPELLPGKHGVAWRTFGQPLSISEIESYENSKLISGNLIDSLRTLDPWLLHHQYGWPFSSLEMTSIVCYYQESESDFNVFRRRDTVPEIVLVEGEWPNTYSDYVLGGVFHTWQRCIPLIPCWGGLILSTMFYALLLKCMIFGLCSIRKYIRRTRVLCVQCGYNLKGCVHKGCPECGWDRE